MGKEIKLKPEENSKSTIDPTEMLQEFDTKTQQMTPEQQREKQLNEEAMLDNILPYLRKQVEATELEMKLTRFDVQLGRLNPNSIPGSFGKSLEIEEMETLLHWGTLKGQQIEQQDMFRKKQAELEKEKEKITNSAAGEHGV